MLKLGIFSVELVSLDRKGLSKDDLGAASATPRCWPAAMAARAAVVGSCWRAQARSRAVEAEAS